ncbi:MAG: PadR family transcriptional regulator [Candidatus Helarchaeota archaeon]
MRYGFFKILMLKIIASNEEMTGYSILKTIESITNRRPSSGSIYPILKSMEKAGWIQARKEKDKIYYLLTSSGKEKLQEFNTIKHEFHQKIIESIKLADESFEDSWVKAENPIFSEIIISIFAEIIRLKQQGISPTLLTKTLQDFKKQLQSLSKSIKDDNYDDSK